MLKPHTNDPNREEQLKEFAAEPWRWGGQPPPEPAAPAKAAEPEKKKK